MHSITRKQHKAIARRKRVQRAQNIWRKTLPKRMTYMRAMPDGFITEVEKFINHNNIAMATKAKAKPVAKKAPAKKVAPATKKAKKY